MTTTVPELETPRLYIANTPNLKPIGVRAAVSAPLVQYTCLHCGENLSLITDGETYWFEHRDSKHYLTYSDDIYRIEKLNTFMSEFFSKNTLFQP